MSELQISLIVLGIVIILGVVAYNWWQDRRVSKKMQQNLPVVQEDPLLRDAAQQATRREPGLGHLGLQEVASSPEGEVEAALDTAEGVASLTDQAPDSLIEEVIVLVLPTPKTGAQLLDVIKKLSAFGSKPVRMLVQNMDGLLSTQIDPNQSYQAVQLAVLIANRSGPLTAIEWSQIWAKAADLAEELEARIEGRDHNEVVARAEQLDATCASVDMQVGLNLLLDRSRQTEDIIKSAMGMGFVELEDELAWVADHGLACFTLHRIDGQPFEDGTLIDKVSLLLDVPRSPACDDAFSRMMEVGAELSRRLGAVMVDDQGAPLVQGAESVIDEQLQTLYQQLDDVGLAAGSARARRVFA